MENKDFVPYKEAFALKELGFDNVSCFGVYYGDDNEFETDFRETQYSTQKGYKNGILAPIYQQVFRWFIKEHDIIQRIDRLHSKRYFFEYRESDNTLKSEEPKVSFYDTYEEAELACLKKLIEVLKNK